MQTLYTKRFSRVEVSHNILSFANLQAALDESVLEFIDYDIKDHEWIVVFRKFENDDAR